MMHHHVFKWRGCRTGRVHRCITTISKQAAADKHVAAFTSILGPSGVITDSDDLVGYNTDWTGEFQGNARVVLRPANTRQVSETMRYCFANDIPVVPQGGNTGLVGGSVSMRSNEIILSLSRMNHILDFDGIAGALTCEAGVTLQAADEFCRARQHVMPLDLGSKGSCRVGGNLATNAGGIRLIKYGSLRGNVLGLEVVLSDGTVLDSLRTLRKDNVGYDLKQIFVGSEGTLGIITKCALLTPTLDPSASVCLLALDSFEHALKALRIAKSTLGSGLSAFEYLDSAAMELVLKHSAGKMRHPLQQGSNNFYLVVEVSGRDSGENSRRIEQLLDNLTRDGLVKDGVVSDSEKQFKEIWGFRENITSSLRSSGMRVFKYDVSLPVALLHPATEYVRAELKKKGLSKVQVFEYGHLGDGNLHFNAACPKDGDARDMAQVQIVIESALYSYVRDKQGSISAEHGLGQLKASKILYSRSPAEVEWMKRIKQTMDPKGLLNPGKVLI